MTAADLVGAWELTELRSERDGRERRPFGEAPQGLLVYSACGSVSAILSRRDRARLNSGLEGAHRASEEARAQAFATYLSYGGRYRVEGEEVVHAIELALVPDLVGGEVRRRARFDGEALVLDYEAGGVRWTLRWRRR